MILIIILYDHDHSDYRIASLSLWYKTEKMKKNLGISDRIIRFVAIDFLLGFSFLGYEIPEIYATLAFIGSFYLAITMIIGYDPIYHLFGIDTRDEVMKNAKS